MVKFLLYSVQTGYVWLQLFLLHINLSFVMQVLLFCLFVCSSIVTCNLFPQVETLAEDQVMVVDEGDMVEEVVVVQAMEIKVVDMAADMTTTVEVMWRS